MARLRQLSVMLVLLAGCHGCRRPPAPKEKESSPLSFVPKDALAVLAPHVGSALERVGALGRTLATIPGAEVLARGAEALERQLGVDPAKPDALAGLGIDPTGLALVWRPAGVEEPVLALPVADLAKLGEHLGELARRAGAVGATKPLSTAPAGYLAADGRCVLTAVVRDGFVVLTTGPAEGLTPPPLEQSLGARPGLATALESVGSQDLLVLLSHEGQVVCLGLRPSAQGIRAKLAVPLLAPILSTLTTSLASSARSMRVWALPADAALTLRLGVDPAAIGSLFGDQPPAALSRTLRAGGLDLQRDLLGNLAPGIAGAFSLASAPDFSTAPSFDPSLANPLHWVRLRLFAEVRDGRAARAALERLPATGPAWGVQYQWHQVEGQRVLTARYALGESLSLALVERTLIVTGGPGEMAAALAQGHAGLPDKAAGALLSVRLDSARLGAQVRGIPLDAYGGLEGLTLRSLVARVLEPLAHLGVVALDVNLGGGALVADIDLPLR